MTRKSIQYTLRAVPRSIDEELRRRAAEQRRSLNDVAIEALQEGLDLQREQVHTDLDELIGTWVEDPEFDKAMAAQDQIDEELWK
jgi:hypothetical protein